MARALIRGGIVVVFVLAGCTTIGQTGGAAASRADRIVDDWAAFWSSHDLEKGLALFTDDCVYEDVTFGAVNKGKAELRNFANSNFAAFPDLKIQLTTRVIAGNRAAMEWVMTGTHKGDLPGMPATNKSFSVRGATVLELRQGKISRDSDYWDSVTLLKQLGLMPSQ